MKPKILIGVSGSPNSFTEKIVKMMCSYAERPIILALSNPTTLCEIKPINAIKWSDGKIFFATGSPFPNVEYKGKTYIISQCNNALIFPGLTLGMIASKARKMT